MMISLTDLVSMYTIQPRSLQGKRGPWERGYCTIERNF